MQCNPYWKISGKSLANGEMKDEKKKGDVGWLLKWMPPPPPPPHPPYLYPNEILPSLRSRANQCPYQLSHQADWLNESSEIVMRSLCNQAKINVEETRVSGPEKTTGDRKTMTSETSEKQHGKRRNPMALKVEKSNFEQQQWPSSGEDISSHIPKTKYSNEPTPIKWSVILSGKMQKVEAKSRRWLLELYRGGSSTRTLKLVNG